MKKTVIYLVALLFLPLLSQAQSKNVFLDRAFWTSNPSLEDIKTKIKEGNDPIELNDHSFNATAYAILNDMPLETIKFFLSLENNNVNTLTHDGRIYLHWAATKGNLEAMKFLISKGAKTNVVDNHGYSVLNFAATTGQKNPEMYDLLLANGSKLTETNHDGANALLLLIPHLKDFEMVDYFTSKGLDLNGKDNEGNGAFYYAAKTGNIEMMDKLIAKGVEYKGYNKTGGNAMIAASQGTRRSSNPLSVFQYLEKKGIKPNVVTKEKVTPLHGLAARSKDEEVILYFIGKGVDVNQQDQEGNTALMRAAALNEMKIVKLIANKSKNINTSNKEGKTALTNAVAGNSAEVVSYLFAKGAKVDVKDKDGNNLAYYLVKSYRPGNEAAFDEKLALLKKEGLNLKAKQAEGNTLLHLAVAENNFNLIKKMVDMGLDINTPNEKGTTPIQIAAMKATDDVILKYLIEKGADKMVVTNFDETLYDLASENELLRAKGVDIKFLK